MSADFWATFTCIKFKTTFFFLTKKTFERNKGHFQTDKNKSGFKKILTNKNFQLAFSSFP